MLTSAMIQNIEQTAAEFARSNNPTLDEVQAQAEAQFEAEYFDFDKTPDVHAEYIAAYVRGANVIRPNWELSKAAEIAAAYVNEFDNAEDAFDFAAVNDETLEFELTHDEPDQVKREFVAGFNGHKAQTSASFADDLMNWKKKAQQRREYEMIGKLTLDNEGRLARHLSRENVLFLTSGDIYEITDTEFAEFAKQHEGIPNLEWWKANCRTQTPTWKNN